MTDHPNTREKGVTWAVTLLGVSVALILAVSIKTYTDQQNTNQRIVTLANEHHADSDAISKAQQAEILHVNQLAIRAERRACLRSNQTRRGLFTFFEDSLVRQIARARIDSGPTRRLDLEGAVSSRRSARAERPDHC